MSTRIACILCALAATTPLQARTFDVFPGPGTPLQDGINGAATGDTVRANAGTYTESVLIDRGVKLVGRSAVIEAGCDRPAAIEVASGGVDVRSLTVHGGETYTILVVGRDHIRVKAVHLLPRATGGSCAPARFGVYVSASTNVDVVQTDATDAGTGDVYADSAFYVDSIGADARVRLARVFTNLRNARGIVVNDSTGTLIDHFAVLLAHDDVVNSDTGILLSNTDGIDVNHNGVSGSSAVGIDVDSGSDRNFLKANVSETNALDVRDQGTNNCWTQTTFKTGSVPGCP